MKHKLTKALYKADNARKISQARKIVKTFTNYIDITLLSQKNELLKQKR